MTNIKSYKELFVWQKSMDLVEIVFLLTEKFPSSELYGITSQMRRSAVSIPSGIAEGFGRKSTKEYKHFVSVSHASALELETQLIISKRLGFGENTYLQTAKQLLAEIIPMLNSLWQKLDSRTRISH